MGGVATSFPLCGIRYRDWRKLREITGEIAPRQRKRALRIATRSLLNEAMHALDQAQFGRLLQEQHVEPPLIVLGLARSGTTFLHHLLGYDPKSGFPTVAQVLHPHTFLTREGYTRGVLAYGLRGANMLLSFLEFRGQPGGSGERGVDRAQLNSVTPEEDEFALLNSIQSAPFLKTCFPLDSKRLDGIEQKERWQAAWLGFLRKLSVISPGRRLLLKSPFHMTRLPWIVDLFPDARFVFISRRPESIFPSAVSLQNLLLKAWSLQELGLSSADTARKVEEVVFSAWREQILSYLEHRALIPAGHLHELRYEDLVREPEVELEKLYRALGLPGFDACRPFFREALRERAGHQTNVYPELSKSQRERLRTEWAPYYEAFGYA
jgi:hypothetical protein